MSHSLAKQYNDTRYLKLMSHSLAKQYNDTRYLKLMGHSQHNDIGQSKQNGTSNLKHMCHRIA